MNRPFNRTLFCLSGLRAILGFMFIIVFNRYSETSAWIALTLMILAQASDHLDGYVARKYSEPTVSGYLQDSIADKLFQIAALLSVVREYELPVILVWLVIFRDLVLLGTRVVESDNTEKMKEHKIYSILFATFLRFGILLLVLGAIIHEYQSHLVTAGSWLVWLSLIPAGWGQLKLLKSFS
jgi:phosphatidylglycerophosphate synthase